jgi:hypothetical protein
MLHYIALDVYRSSTSPVPIDAGHQVTSGITETNYTDCGNVYNRYYAVTAVNENGESAPSNEDRASESCESAAAMTLPVLNATALTESAADPVVTKCFCECRSTVADSTRSPLLPVRAAPCARSGAALILTNGSF